MPGTPADMQTPMMEGPNLSDLSELAGQLLDRVESLEGRLEGVRNRLVGADKEVGPEVVGRTPKTGFVDQHHDTLRAISEKVEICSAYVSVIEHAVG